MIKNLYFFGYTMFFIMCFRQFARESSLLIFSGTGECLVCGLTTSVRSFVGEGFSFLSSLHNLLSRLVINAHCTVHGIRSRSLRWDGLGPYHRYIDCSVQTTLKNLKKLCFKKTVVHRKKLKKTSKSLK